MKKLLIILFCFVSAAVFAEQNMSYISEINYANHLTKARSEYQSIHKTLSDAAGIISRKGKAGFKKIVKINRKLESGIFIIDPSTGKVLLSPAIKVSKKDSLYGVKLNGKLISKEAIAVARSKIRYNPWEEWSSFIGKMYRDYFTALAITDKGKVYVLAIGKNNIQLQRLFVEKIVKKACFLIKEKGIEKALEEFKRDESIFKCGNNYVFVYRYVSDDKVICLYNPNYMDNIGKNMINYKTGLGYFARKIVKLKDPGFGWIKTLTKVPGGEKPQIKHIFVRYVAAQGKQYIVGAGVYYIKKD